MYKQLQKNITAFYELFPDFHPDEVDLQVLGAVPFTNASDLFCSDCAVMMITAEDCKQMTPKTTVLKKLNFKQEAPQENGMNLYKRAAARLISSFSITQKSCKTVEQGFDQGSQRLSTVDREMRSVLKEKAILLSRGQRREAKIEDNSRKHIV